MADEQDRLRKLRALAAQQAADAAAKAKADAEAKEKADAYYIRDPKTGLSQAQLDAQKALQEAAEAQGGGYIRTAKSAGSVISKPTTPLPAGQEWKWFPVTGGGGSWKAVKTSTTTGNDDGKGGGGGGPTGTNTTTTYTAPDGKVFTDFDAYNAYLAQLKADEKRRTGQSAYDLLFAEFENYGLGALIAPLQSFIIEGLSPAEFTLRLRQTDAYKKRFAANAQRINKGLRALSEAEYIGLEDQYQNVMRNYGLPKEYYARGEMGVQQGFEKFIGGDVSAAELEDRIQTAQNRVVNAAPEVSRALREFYPDITGGDILAYALDPEQALTGIKRKVTAAEIGGAAMGQGLATGLSRAEELARYGVTGEQARQGFQTVAGVLPRASTLGSIYGKQGLGDYTQATAEQEVFGLTGAAEAERKRRKLSELEQAQFGGSAGVAGGALGRERAGQF